MHDFVVLSTPRWLGICDLERLRYIAITWLKVDEILRHTTKHHANWIRSDMAWQYLIEGVWAIVITQSGLEVRDLGWLKYCSSWSRAMEASTHLTKRGWSIMLIKLRHFHVAEVLLYLTENDWSIAIRDREGFNNCDTWLGAVEALRYLTSGCGGIAIPDWRVLKYCSTWLKAAEVLQHTWCLIQGGSSPDQWLLSYYGMRGTELFW